MQPERQVQRIARALALSGPWRGVQAQAWPALVPERWPRVHGCPVFARFRALWPDAEARAALRALPSVLRACRWARRHQQAHAQRVLPGMCSPRAGRAPAASAAPHRRAFAGSGPRRRHPQCAAWRPDTPGAPDRHSGAVAQLQRVARHDAQTRHRARAVARRWPVRRVRYCDHDPRRAADTARAPHFVARPGTAPAGADGCLPRPCAAIRGHRADSDHAPPGADRRHRADVAARGARACRDDSGWALSGSAAHRRAAGCAAPAHAAGASTRC